MVDTAKRNAPRLAPLLCSERISPLLCRCFFFSSQGDGRAARKSTSAFGLHLKRRRSKPFGGDRRAPPWLGSRCLHPFSPLFDATTIAHNAPRSSDMFEAFISHFTCISLKKKKRSNRFEQEPALIEIDRSQRQPKEALPRAAQHCRGNDRSGRSAGGARGREGVRARARERE